MSRAATLVSTLAASITTSTEDSSNGSAIRICPWNRLNRPYTLDIPMCRATKRTELWSPSMTKTPGRGGRSAGSSPRTMWPMSACSPQDTSTTSVTCW